MSFLKANKLRVNSFTFINHFFVNIDLYTRKTTPPELLLEKINSIRQKYGEIVKGYAEMDVDKKVEMVKQLDDLFIGLLELFRPSQFFRDLESHMKGIQERLSNLEGIIQSRGLPVAFIRNVIGNLLNPVNMALLIAGRGNEFEDKE